MPNQVFGPFSAISITAGVTAVNKPWGDNAQLQAQTAINSLNPDFSGAFVHSGITCARNGVTLNQLDVATGIAYLTMSDGTVAKIAVGPSSAGQFVTVTPSTTYYLFLKNDGTWQWSTTSTAANAIPIAQATTDGSGNINVVTDVRHTAGSPGVPYTVARDLRHAITVTTTVALAAHTTPVTGMYRASLHFTYRNPTPQKVVAQIAYWDADLNASTGGSFQPTASAAIGQWLNGSQAATTGNNQSIPCQSIDFYAMAGHPCQVSFTDGGGTPNSVASVIIQRIG